MDLPAHEPYPEARERERLPTTAPPLTLPCETEWSDECHASPECRRARCACTPL